MNDAQVKSFLADLSQRWDQANTTTGTREAYKSAQQNRLNRDWLPLSVSGDTAIGESFPLTTARIRDQIRNEPIMRKAAAALIKNIVGTGIQSFADVLLSSDDLFDDFNFEADELFSEWAEDECDVEGRLSFADMQALAFREVVTVGEAILLRCQSSDPQRLTPLCYQLLEAEQLDDTKHQFAGEDRNAIVRGIEYDPQARPVAYWLYLDHPHDVYTSTARASVRIPADRVIHLFLPMRPSEGRGISWFTALMQTARDSDHLIGNELTASAIASLLTVLVKRKNGGTASGSGFGGPNADSTDANYNPLFRLGKGTVAEVGSEDDVKVVESGRPGSSIAPFIRFLQQVGSMAIDLSYLRLTGDYSSTNYTSARGAHLDDDATFRPIQNWLAKALVKPIRRAVQRQFAARGHYQSVSTGQFFAQQRRFQRLHLQPPGRDQLDPGMETAAAADRIRYMLSDWDRECGARGVNFRRTVLKQKQQRAFAARHGVPLDLSTNPQSVQPADSRFNPAPLPTTDDEE